MPRYEVLSEDGMDVLDAGWRRLVSELGVRFGHPEDPAVFAGPLVSQAALAKVDMSRFRDTYGNGAVPSLPAVKRMFDIIDGKVASN